MIWASVSDRSCFCWLNRASPSLAAKNIINLISVLTIWWCPRIESSLVLLEEVTSAMTSVFSWQNSISLFPASFHTLVPNLPVKAMAPHSSTLAWQIPWMEEPGRLQSMGSLRVGHDWASSLSLFTVMHWRRKWQPTPVFLPGDSQGRWSLMGCRLRGCIDSDTTEES